jgi:hypothetical protein
MTIYISGFPGIGKSYIANENIADSDSSLFSKDGFPTNYIDFITTQNKPIQLISSHKEVRKELEIRNIAYTLVYPAINLKEEYIQRYINRGSTEAFIAFISSNWESFILDIEKEKHPTLIKLEQGQYLKEVINLIK